MFAFAALLFAAVSASLILKVLPGASEFLLGSTQNFVLYFSVVLKLLFEARVGFSWPESFDSEAPLSSFSLPLLSDLKFLALAPVDPETEWLLQNSVPPAVGQLVLQLVFDSDSLSPVLDLHLCFVCFGLVAAADVLLP